MPAPFLPSYDRQPLRSQTTPACFSGLGLQGNEAPLIFHFVAKLFNFIVVPLEKGVGISIQSGVKSVCARDRNAQVLSLISRATEKVVANRYSGGSGGLDALNLD